MNNLDVLGLTRMRYPKLGVLARWRTGFVSDAAGALISTK
jgi:hypothetical protein